MKLYVFTALMAFSTLVNASDWFLEFELGRASTDSPTISLPSELGEGSVVRTEDEHTGYGINVGYRLNDKWSIVAGYVDLGEGELVFEGETLTPAAFAEAVSQTPILADGFTLSTRYEIYSQDSIAVDVELGLIRWDANVESVSSVGTARLDEQSTDLLWGATFSYDFTPEWRVKAGYRSYELEERIAFPHIGFQYSF